MTETDLRHRSRLPAILSIVFLCAFGGQVALSLRQNAETIKRLDIMSAKIDVMRDQLLNAQERGRSKVITTQWTSGGMRRELTSKWRELNENETYEEFLARHDSEVGQALKVFPRDP